MAGLGSRTEAKYSGTDEQLAETQRLAHRDLTLDDGQTPISVELQSQAHREDKITPANTMLIHEATDYIFQHDHNIPEDKSINYLPETTDSEPESDEEKWMSDSDADNNNNTYQQTNNNNSGRHVARLSNNNVNNINYSGNTTSGRPATNRNYQSRRSSNNPSKKNNTNRNKHDDDSDKKGN
jgi:hypothetical protein